MDAVRARVSFILVAAVTAGLAVQPVAATVAAMAAKPASSSSSSSLSTDTPRFAGNCGRPDMIALTERLGRGVTCAPGMFGERGVFVTHGATTYVFAADGMRATVAPTQIEHGPGWKPIYRVVDLDGDGVDEIVMISREGPNTYHFKPGVHSYRLRVLAVRNGRLVMTGDHAYAINHNPIANARYIYLHDRLE